MVTLRFAVPAILATAAAVGCFSYLVSVILLARLETDARSLDVRLPPAVLDSSSPSTRASTQIDQPPSEDELAAAAFEKAAEAILRRAPNARASAGSDELSIRVRSHCPKGGRSHVDRIIKSRVMLQNLSRGRPVAGVALYGLSTFLSPQGHG